MKRLIYLNLIVIYFITSCGTPRMSKSNEICKNPDKRAEFEGGPQAMKKYLSNNLNYPEVAMKNGDEGKVYLDFIIEKDGSTSNVKILRGVSREIDREAIRVIEEMPNWTPAIYKGKYVRTRARMPINFVLE